MKRELEANVAAAVDDLYGLTVAIELTRPEEKFGDYATNVALQISKELGKNPREIANEILAKLQNSLADRLESVTIAGPGFINLRLSDKALIEAMNIEPEKSLIGKSIVAEYSDPNPFKVLHAGHLYTSLVGDAVASLMEYAGAEVHRVNFGGDVGLHVGKTMWAILDELGGEFPDKLADIADTDQDKLDWVSQRYVIGTTAYEEDSQAKQDIASINKRVYEIHDNDDHDSDFAKIYWTCRKWSYEGFDELYKRLQMAPFDKYYPESTVSDLGLATVKKHTGKVYEESDGAVIFRGEPYGLFTQVFINSEGLPTYAAKDVGLIYHKNEDFSPDMSFIFTDVSQKDHLAVVMKSIEQYAPDLVAATTHYTHGQIKMAGGVKMSSRKGNILKASDILDAAKTASIELSGQEDHNVVLAAVKYAFLKNRIGGDIVYDPKESVSMEGNSGPYLQYAHARARSILKKVDTVTEDQPINIENLEDGERSLVRKITEYPEVVDKAVADLMPHHITTYLYELAQSFNRFYEHNRVIGENRQSQRLALVNKYADTLKIGLGVLEIPTPDRM